jgi:hypothetical protein
MCGMDGCPSTCGDGCLNADGQCTCAGTDYTTYLTSVAVQSSDPTVVTASYSGGVLTITAGKAGTANVTVTGQLRKYTDGAATVQVTSSADISGVTIAPIPDQTYTGSPITPALTVTLGGKTLAPGTDYKASYTNNVKAGTATATITGIGNYTGTKSATFKIVAASIAKATIAAIADQTYTGSALTPSVTVAFNGKTLKKGTDYTVVYSSNVNCGTASVTLTGIGNFTGTATASFRIIPAKVAISKAATGSLKGTVVVSWAQGKGGVTGYEVAYATRSNGTYVSAGLTTQLSMTVGSLKSGTTYYFKVRAYVVIGSTKYYGAWSNVLSAKAK